MAAGGLVGSRRVARTMSFDITRLSEASSLTASGVASGLVTCATVWALPVSTTHVACGSLFGIGAASREARWRTIRDILGSWLGTLPCAAVAGAIAFAILRAFAERNR